MAFLFKSHEEGGTAGRPTGPRFLACKLSLLRESLFPGAGRRGDDASMVLSTTVTSPEAEEEGGVKTTPRFQATGSEPTGPSAPSRPKLLCLGQTVPNLNDKKVFKKVASATTLKKRESLIGAW